MHDILVCNFMDDTKLEYWANYKKTKNCKTIMVLNNPNFPQIY